MQQFRKGFLKKALTLLLVLSICISMITVGQANAVSAAAVSINTGYKASDFGTLLEESKQFIVVKHKQLGGSHYAYTDGLSDETGSPMGNEVVFRPGSEMVLVTLAVNGAGSVTRTEQVLLSSPSGVIRDPDVSEDGTKVLFSWKKDSADDFHLYEMNIAEGASSCKQLTFGSGVADVEPKYLANGKIVFNSTRCISNVDCWLIAVMNLYTCDADGSNIMRLGYDQVHTTYPTTTEDGRILYTRWDYNDRNQMYVQSVFQMFPDGTNQTEVYGNDSNFPTTLLHTREVPGSTGLYVSISSGHHNWQAGKLVLVDTSMGRNDEDAVTYPFPDAYCNKNDNVDTQGQAGPLYKYPVALNDHEFLVSYCESGWGGEATQFGIYYMNSQTGRKICISNPGSDYGASQVAMVKTKDLFERPSMVNQAVEYGTYYMGNVYMGGGLEGVEFGAAKYLRVVEIEYRPYAIGATIGVGTGTSDPYTPISTGNGAWDVKRVLGIVEIEADGSALFRVPANTPIYFQVLNEDGEMIQSMRSWSTLMPNETFSCVGCHEDKNTVPPFDATTTLAMKKGVQELKPDLWMTKEDGTEYAEGEYDVEEDTKGFSYTEQVQPILDANCISCHNDAETSYNKIGISAPSSDDTEDVTVNEEIPLIELGSDFKYTMTKQNGNAWSTSDYDSLTWGTGGAPFGCRDIGGHPLGTFLDVDGQTIDLYMRKDFTISSDQFTILDAYDVYLRIFYDENPVIYLNGTEIYSASGWVDNGYVDVNISKAFASAAVSGNNELAAYCANAGGGMFIDFGIYLVPKQILIANGNRFQYTTTKQNDNNWLAEDFNDISWNTGNAPFGSDTIDGNAPNTNLNVPNLYLRSSFTLSQKIYDDILTGNYAVFINISWDEDPTIYLNGTAILSETSWTPSYRTLNITSAFIGAMKIGYNTVAASLINRDGGQFIDFSIYLIPKEKATLVAQGSSFKYTTRTPNNNNWITTGYNDNSWNTGNAPFGTGNISGNGVNTNWTSNNLYLRSSFNVTQEQYQLIQAGEYTVYMDIAWDEEPTIYVNGTVVLAQTGYTTDYRTIDITSNFMQAVQVGTNTLAAQVLNTTGGQFLDFSIYLVPNAQMTLVEQESSFKYNTTVQADGSWTGENYNDASWNTGNAPFGTGSISGNGVNTTWTSSNLYVRSSFTLTQAQYDLIQAGKYAVYMNIAWDEEPAIYLNGTKILSQSSYSTEYHTIKISSYTFTKAAKVGTNTLAASVMNTVGGQFLDFSIYLKPQSSSDVGAAFSLKGTDVEGPRERIYYSLSYLVLTDSKLNGNQYVGNSTNSYTNWISSMSQCEMLNPYQYGSTQSNIISMLKDGHQGVTLTEKELHTIVAWIDLGVPFRGAYDESTNWGTGDYREATEKQNKRDYYTALDEATKRISTGKVDTDALPITISYTTGGTEIASVTENGLAYLYPETKYTAGSKVTVTLPEGVTYFFLGLDSRVGEALIYCPTGTYTYTIPSDTSNIFPATFNNAAHPTITARIATVEELAETRNLAVNPYDVATNAVDAASYPHASASTQYNSSEFAARNAIDGAAVNEGHGTYPVQSWGAAEADSNMYYVVNFGTEVCVSSVDIAVRADWSGNHDTYFTSAVLEFSDGTTQNITLTQDSDIQSFAIEDGPKETSYVKITSMETANDNWAGLSEVEVYGTVYPEGEIPLMNVTVDEAITLDVGDSHTLNVTYLPENTTENGDATWTSSDESVVVVGNNGKILALRSGTATITLTVGDFVKSCVVTVAGSDVERFDIAFASMNMANSLDMNFAFEKGHASDWNGHYAVITKTYADGRPDVTQTVPFEEWKSTKIDGIEHYYVTFKGISAKEMTDTIYVTIYNADGEAVSNVWKDSVREQVQRVLKKENETEFSKTLVVDMVNYGAAAQEYFDYALDSLATDYLSEEQKAFATQSTVYEDTRVAGTNYVASNVYLKSNIQFIMAFNNITTDMHAVVTFTNHRGVKKTLTIEGTKFQKIEGRDAVVIDELVVADGRQEVTCKIYDGDVVVAEATDSLESYVARITAKAENTGNTEEYELFEKIMKFSDSAYAYLHNK